MCDLQLIIDLSLFLPGQCSTYGRLILLQVPIPKPYNVYGKYWKSVME